jgi:hypothetical protein
VQELSNGTTITFDILVSIEPKKPHCSPSLVAKNEKPNHKLGDSLLHLSTKQEQNFKGVEAVSLDLKDGLNHWKHSDDLLESLPLLTSKESKEGQEL